MVLCSDENTTSRMHFSKDVDMMQYQKSLNVFHINILVKDVGKGKESNTGTHWYTELCGQRLFHLVFANHRS